MSALWKVIDHAILFLLTSAQIVKIICTTFSFSINDTISAINQSRGPLPKIDINPNLVLYQYDFPLVA